ncbi:MAG: pectate lyase [Prevotella sp.]|nr:pectate lyase [Prevotella sp.]
MKRYLTSLFFIFSALFISSITAQTPAFPGAEGHGRYANGGRGGVVRHVTNLNDSGTGSFRSAVSGSTKKIVVFDVGGVIALKSNVSIGANTTIMGQTAPAPGITLRYYTVNPNGNNIIIRFVRFRRGQEKDINDGADASTARHFTNLMLDHCSLSWSIDEVASFYDNNNFTMQWCTIGESLCNAGHGKGAHGYGGIWGGKLASFHHNLICHVNNRSPRFNGARYNWTGYTANSLYTQYQWENAVQAENVDFRNCVVYNCGNGCYGGPGGGKINMVGNYYKSGPAGSTTRLTQVTVGASGNAEGYPIYWDMTSRYFVDGNTIDNKAAGWETFAYDDGTISRNGKRWSKDPNHYNGANEEYITVSGTDYICMQLDEPAPIGDVTTHEAATAFQKVTNYAGASLCRDNVDERYMEEAKKGTATYKGSVTGKPGRIDLVSDVQGYTEANFGTGSRPSNFDTDKDGIPDEWETANGLNPSNANDATLYTLDPQQYYTNIEVYCNSLVQDIMLDGNANAIEEQAVKEYYPAYKTEDGTPVEAINPTIKPDDPNDDPSDGTSATGTITWTLNALTATQGEVSSELSPYLSASEVTVGSNLTMDKARRDLMVDFKAVQKEGGPAATNALTFTITTQEGCQFQPTKVAFYTERAGTDSGYESVTWQGATPTAIEANLQPERNNYTQYEKVLTDIDPNSGTSTLLINIYGLNAGKAIAVGNVVITGKVIYPSTGGLKGDVNDDKTVDVADISAILTEMAGDKDQKADVNEDGIVDVADISTVLTIMAGNKQ